MKQVSYEIRLAVLCAWWWFNFSYREKLSSANISIFILSYIYVQNSLVSGNTRRNYVLVWWEICSPCRGYLLCGGVTWGNHASRGLWSASYMSVRAVARSEDFSISSKSTSSNAPVISPVPAVPAPPAPPVAASPPAAQNYHPL